MDRLGDLSWPGFISQGNLCPCWFGQTSSVSPGKNQMVCKTGWGKISFELSSKHEKFVVLVFVRVIRFLEWQLGKKISCMGVLKDKQGIY